jgi:hypothetical protein
MVQVVCPECRQEFDVPDGAEEATCPNCSEVLVWRSCLDTNEVFTVLKKWETWVHPGCETKHPVDLTNVIAAARPQDALDAPIESDGQPQPAGGMQAPAPSDLVYAPVELSPDVDWPDQEITGRLIVDSDRLAILPAPGNPRPPLSVAWIQDVQDYAVHPGDGDGKKKRFGRKAKAEPTGRQSTVVFTVPGGQITIASASPVEVFAAQLDQHLRPRLTGAPGMAPPQAPMAPPQAPMAPPQAPMAPPQAPMAPPQPPMAPPQPQAPMAQPPGGTSGVMPVPGTLPTYAAPIGDVPGGQPAGAVETGPQGSAAAPTAPSAPQGLEGVDPARLPDLEPKTPEAVYDSIRKLAELAVLGQITSEEFATRKAQLLARL